MKGNEGKWKRQSIVDEVAPETADIFWGTGCDKFRDPWGERGFKCLKRVKKKKNPTHLRRNEA